MKTEEGTAGSHVGDNVSDLDKKHWVYGVSHLVFMPLAGLFLRDRLRIRISRAARSSSADRTVEAQHDELRGEWSMNLVCPQSGGFLDGVLPEAARRKTLSLRRRSAV